MSSPSPSPDTEPQPNPGTRDFILYLQVGIAMVPLVFLMTGLCAGLDYLVVLFSDLGLAQQVQSAAQKYRDTADFVPQLMKLLGPRMHWGAVALMASLITFPLLGWILGRYAHDPSWAGILPLVDLASGHSPLTMGVPELPEFLSLPEQVGILVVQILTVHGTAWWVHSRRQAPATE